MNRAGHAANSLSRLVCLLLLPVIPEPIRNFMTGNALSETSPAEAARAETCHFFKAIDNKQEPERPGTYGATHALYIHR